MGSLEQNNAFPYNAPILKPAVSSHENVRQLHVSKRKEHPLIFSNYFSGSPVVLEFLSVKFGHFFFLKK